MIGLIIALSVLCLLLIVALTVQDNRDVKMSVENGLLKGRMETLQEKIMSPSEKESLTADNVVTALQSLGLEIIERGEENVRFIFSEESFLIETHHLPVIFVSRTYTVNPDEWNNDLLRKAAHQMSDDLLMVKAEIYENQNGWWNIQFFVAAMDRNVDSFRRNLTTYIDIIGKGSRQLSEIYRKMDEMHEESTVPLNAYLGMANTENKIKS